MKAINLIRVLALSVILLTAATITSFSGNPVVTSSTATALTLQNTLSTALTFPKDCIKSDYEGTVNVIFVIDKGKLVVEKATSENKELETFVKAELGKICCKDIKTLTNQHFQVKLSFVLEEI